MLNSARTEEDDSHAGRQMADPKTFPAIGACVLDIPEPQQSGKDVNSTICGIRSTCVSGINASQGHASKINDTIPGMVQSALLCIRSRAQKQNIHISRRSPQPSTKAVIPFCDRLHDRSGYATAFGRRAEKNGGISGSFARIRSINSTIRPCDECRRRSDRPFCRSYL